jgi:RNA polymerase sigma-54 factor
MGNQTLGLSQQQRLQMVLAPQLRQSLEMLQLPVMELRTMIQQELEQNATLEEIPTETDVVEIEPGNGELEEQKELDFEKEFEALAQLDDEWRDYFFQDDAQPYRSRSELSEKHQFVLDSLPQLASLQEHLIGQLRLAGLSEDDQEIGELIIGSIDDDGYLTTDIDDLATAAGLDSEHVSDMLALIQDFQPTGVGARSLKECLHIQLSRLGQEPSVTWDLVENHLGDLGAKKYQSIARAMNITLDDVRDAAHFIGTLDPKPGRVHSTEVATYVYPEVVVQRVDGEYVVVLNDDQVPHVRISNHYRTLMKEKDTTAEVKSYIKERVRAGAFLIKSIHQRQKTIHKVATEIITVQKEFLDHGIAHLKPLTMSEVADTVGVHETTVSRAVSGKYMTTPKGIFEMKYFFSTGLMTADGRSVSNQTIKDMLAKLVANEDPTKPLSDQEILEKLKEDSITIARRTIAKYRLVLRIPPSHLRKAL